MALIDQNCGPCEGNTVPLFRSKAEELLKEIPSWKLAEDGKSIWMERTFKDFVSAMHYAGNVGQLAELEGHHPDLLISYGKVGISLTTHAIGGLSMNDFILASKIDTLKQ